MPQHGAACTAALGRRDWLLVSAALAVAAGVAACGGSSAAADAIADDAPRAAPLPWPNGVPPARRVAWVLGSGGPRGFVHVGVLKALEEMQLAPDMIVGASAGALVGALRAAGIGALRIEQLALELQPWQVLRWQPWAEERWSGHALAAWVDRELGGRPLQGLGLPMVCAVQRLRDREVLGFSYGNTGLAVQASAAIEGQLAPLVIGGERYADADLRMPLPVRLARALGASHVLAVDASAHEDRAPPGAERFRDADQRKRALTVPDARLADVLLHPDIGYWAGLSRAYREGLIAAGYRATWEMAAKLKALHA